jgi:hypothetical protein
VAFLVALLVALLVAFPVALLKASPVVFGGGVRAGENDLSRRLSFRAVLTPLRGAAPSGSDRTRSEQVG